MARHTLPFLLLLVLVTILYNLGVSGAAMPMPSTPEKKFIRNACSATTYPALCVKSLMVYASAIQQNQRQLAQTALAVSLTKAEFGKTFVYKLTKFKRLKHREYEAIEDCLEEMGDTVDRLSKSMNELKMGGDKKGKDFVWHMSNVETWVSAAITDENTCLDGFAGRALDGKIKSSIRAQILHVAQVTSNALSLVNKYAEY